MSDARWQDIERSMRSALRHFEGSLSLCDGADSPPDGLEAYKADMAFMHAMQAAHTSLEAALLRILDMLGEQRPTGEQWHKDLVARVCSELTGSSARPAILSRELCSAIHETRRFRNLAVRGYEDFDIDRAAPAAAAARVIVQRLMPEIEAFRRLVDDV